MCYGTGKETCLACTGTNTTNCSLCNNSQSIRCKYCFNGQKLCTTCNAFGSVKWYEELTYDIETLSDDFLKTKEHDIPEKLLKSCKGEIICEKKAKQLTPINHFPDIEISTISKELILKHLLNVKRDKDCIKFGQTHQLRAIPITTCTAKFNKKEITFYIIGKENKIYVPKYNTNCTVL